MRGNHWNRTWLCVLVAALLGGAGQAADFGPTDHLGLDLVLGNGDTIWGKHDNVGRFIVPNGVTVNIRPFDGNLETGWVEVHAIDAVVSGTINARGSGFWGGASGGGGGGGASHGPLGNPNAGSAGVGGSGGGISEDGITGFDGVVFRDGAAVGGLGGNGGAGAGPGAGSAGAGGLGNIGVAGEPGTNGSPGGYLVPGGNGDVSDHLLVFLGSGGGGGGAGAGGGSGNPGPQGMTAGGGGGSGGGGGNGGGAISVFAFSSMRVSGSIDTRGAIGGQDGAPGTDGVVSLNAIGGSGGDGADASTVSGTGQGGTGGTGDQALALEPGTEGGAGGNGGDGGGGGILLFCTSQDGMDLSGATIDARGGADTTANGGTVKIFFAGTDPTPGASVLLAGRIFTGTPLRASHWQLYR